MGSGGFYPRIRTGNQPAGTGGGGPGTTPTIEWGPDFGDQAGDNKTLGASGAISLTGLKADFGEILQGQGSIEDPQFNVIGFGTSKDCSAIDGDGTNQNGLDLTASSIATTFFFTAFDLSGFPTSTVASVDSATLTFTLAAAQAGAVLLELQEIASGDEGWGETTIHGNNEPASAGFIQQFNIANLATGDVSITLSATGRNYILSRMNAGVSTVTFRVIMITALSASVFEDRESGAAIGPRLTFSFTNAK